MPDGTGAPSPPQLAASREFQSLPLDQQVRAMSLLDPDFAGMEPVEQRKAVSGIVAATRAKKPAQFSATYRPLSGKTGYEPARFGPAPATPSLRTALEATAAGPSPEAGFTESALESAVQPVAGLAVAGMRAPGAITRGIGTLRRLMTEPVPGPAELVKGPILGPPTGLPTAKQFAGLAGMPTIGAQLAERNYSGAAGSAVGAVAQLAALGGLKLGPEATRGLGAAARATPAEIAERASPRILSAADEAKGAIAGAIKQARANIEPLYENLHGADEAEIQQSGKAGSIDIGPARQTLGDATEKIFGRTAYPKAVGKAGEKLEAFAPPGTEGQPLATLREARNLRGDLRDMETAARTKQDFKTAAALGQARKELTVAMRRRAEQLGLGKDFDLADAKYRQMREVEEQLRPLIEADSDKFFAGLAKASPETSQALKDLEGAGLKRGRIEELTRQVQVQRRGAGQLPMSFPERMKYGVLPAAAGILAARKLGLPLSGVLASPFLVGYLGGPPIANLFARRAALEGLEALPELVRATPGLGAVAPTAASPLKGLSRPNPANFAEPAPAVQPSLGEYAPGGPFAAPNLGPHETAMARAARLRVAQLERARVAAATKRAATRAALAESDRVAAEEVNRARAARVSAAVARHVRRQKMARYLSGGVQGKLSADDLAAIERETRVDLSNPRNIGKARERLKQLLRR